MHVLAVNSGSSSVKIQLLDMPVGTVLCKGAAQQIGEPQGSMELTTPSGRQAIRERIPDHAAAISRLLGLLTAASAVPVDSVNAIQVVGHRVVHGGERFDGAAVITGDVVRAIEESAALAPLHNPPNLLGIRVAMKMLPNAVQVAVFDTAYHQTLPPRAYLYALPL